MKPETERASSIRRRLLALLVVPATLVLLAGTVSDYVSNITPVRDAYDRALADAALAISGHVRRDASGQHRLVLPAEAISVLRTDAVDSIYFRVSTRDGTFIAGDTDLPVARSSAANPSYQDSTYNGVPIRLVSYRNATGTVLTTVAETLNKRTRIRTQLLSTVLWTDLLELAAILSFVWLGVSLSLQPLQALRGQIAKRSARDLEPLSPASAPVEVRTLVDALNRLFTTIEESSRTQRQFVESATHQLRTPLAGIQAQLELLIAEEERAPRRERLALTLGATRRLSHTTQQLLALARSEHATFAHADFQPVDLAAVAESCATDYVNSAIAADIDLGVELQPASVHGVEWLIAEALGNLVDNAITYTPRGGSITVGCGTRADMAFVEVTDTGIGIPPDERDRVTGRFFRGGQSRGSGSGLGLAIVADVARLHNASLTITSAAEGRGTTVRLEFRALPSPAQRPRTVEAAQPRGALGSDADASAGSCGKSRS
jgi:two-component system, OmpR family, sensor histidine kinase TctE